MVGHFSIKYVNETLICKYVNVIVCARQQMIPACSYKVYKSQKIFISHLRSLALKHSFFFW